ncbi:MAG: glycine hydroxymethyltransferase [Chloroflexi bacterium]|nr:glycine hydroxymethyltransferase [Chloroflexota bacterium]
MAELTVKSFADIQRILDNHDRFRGTSLNMIASENIPSATVRKYLTCDFGGRYPTYGDDPAVRNYLGNQYIAELEIQVQELAKRVFDAKFVDFRPLGGQMAGVATITGLTNPGDLLLETGNCYGGQQIGSKLIQASALRNCLRVEYLPYDAHEHIIDVPKLRAMILEKKPRLVVFGRAHILFPDPIREVRDEADKVGAYIAYDASHVMGLLAGRCFPNPLDNGADVVFGSTHKALPGPQGGMYFTRQEEIYKKVRRALYPPIVTNHHPERIPALAALWLEMLEFGPAYAGQVARNSAALGQALHSRRIECLCAHKGFSTTHQVLVDVSSHGDASGIALRLQEAHIITGAGAIPKDLPSDGKTKSGLRLGTQELTRIGFVERDMQAVADLLKRVVVNREEPSGVAKDVAALVGQFKELRFVFEKGTPPYGPIC